MIDVTLSNPDKILWPKSGFTKRQLVDYYVRVAPVLLPHLANRPLTIARFPDGVDGDGWYQMNCRGAPPWMRIATVTGKRGQTLRYCLVDDARGLAWLANLGTIELHPFLARATAPDEPLALVLDLDPGPDAGILEAARVALAVRASLERRGVDGVVKTSGKKGLHVYAPLSGARFAESKALARAIARELSAAAPERVTERMARAERGARVLVDWRQNDPGLSTVAPYSLRAMPWPLVSTPLGWDELDRALSDGNAAALYFGPDAVLERVARLGDAFAPVAGY